MRLAASRQRQTTLPRLGSLRLDELLALSSGDTVAVEADYAMNALAVDHDVDRIANVAVDQAFGTNAVFADPVARRYAPDIGSG